MKDKKKMSFDYYVRIYEEWQRELETNSHSMANFAERCKTSITEDMKYYYPEEYETWEYNDQ